MSLTYHKSGDTITIVIQDPTYKKIGSWKFNTADRELGEGILKHIQNKYGFSPEISPKDSVGEKNKEIDKEKKEDIDWLNLESNW